jgi:hypothetical protein
MVENSDPLKERSSSYGKEIFPLILRFFIVQPLTHILYIMYIMREGKGAGTFRRPYKVFLRSPLKSE